MSYSCSDFTCNIVNHLVVHGLITADIVDSDDLEHVATTAMQAIRDLARAARAPLAPATGLATRPPVARDQSLSAQFMDELLEAHETLTGIGEHQGAGTLADCMYMLSAVQQGTYIEIHHPTDSEVLTVIRALPSAALWMTFVHEVT